jgi:hypothetical protein
VGDFSITVWLSSTSRVSWPSPNTSLWVAGLLWQAVAASYLLLERRQVCLACCTQAGCQVGFLGCLLLTGRSVPAVHFFRSCPLHQPTVLGAHQVDGGGRVLFAGSFFYQQPPASTLYSSSPCPRCFWYFYFIRDVNGLNRSLLRQIGLNAFATHGGGRPTT